MESEFFGHKKGSFTGATADKEGLFQAANGGTLFFDEVADLPLHMQVKLLRAIQEKAVRPVGAAKEIPIDVRILSATHKDLEALVEEGKFRQDLFYRINVIEVDVPPLRERIEDIEQLTEQILAKLTTETDMLKPRISAGALQALKQYSFPGNVRELENILERALALCENEIIQSEDLRLPREKKTEIAFETNIAVGDGISLEARLGTIEREAIMQALEQTNYNKTAAAKLLGMSFRALRYRLKKLGLD
jgi:two-component system response regulator PilR (NtrC family)